MQISRRAMLAGAALGSGAAMLPSFVGAAAEPTDPDVILARAKADLEAKTEGHIGLWHMDKASWAADLDAGTITFRNPAHWTITAPVQVIGTRATTDGTWLWEWDHPSVPAKLAAHARLVRDFGFAHKRDDLTTRKIEADEERCWLYTALACYLARANGAYRGPAGTAEVFMTFGEIQIRK